ncbi:MAG TPA: sporulation peptidase YabG [Bacillota bacterium]|nr:sporulation peptidase YabG [Bacillota bacterium]
MSIRVGDIVTRKSYGNDLLFIVTSLNKVRFTAFLQGLEMRLMADAPVDDLIKIDRETLENELQKNQIKSSESIRLIHQEHRLLREKNFWMQTGYVEEDRDNELSFEIPGRVLHLDGDGKYLERCIALYQDLGMKVNGFFMPENEMPLHVGRLLAYYQPDILVLTGHDAYRRSMGDQSSLDSYRNSRFFVQAVQEARRFERNKDKLVIFAGACQSNFESLLEAGANFASSPKRINIHTLDPVYIVEKVAYTSVRETVNVFEVAKNTITGMDGLGGIETFGLFRLGLPRTENIRNNRL